MIYLASPYTHPKRSVRYQRFVAVTLATGKLMNEGHLVFAPIVGSHSVAEMCGLPIKWDYWKAFDEKMLAACTELKILMLSGWKTSTGIAAETKIAKKLDLTISYMEPVE